MNTASAVSPNVSIPGTRFISATQYISVLSSRSTQQIDQGQAIEKKLQRSSVMASKFLAKSFVSSLAKAIPPPPLLRRELSRVCFCSASSQPLDTSDEQDKRDSRADFAGASGAVETGKSAEEREKDYADDTKEKTKEMGASMADKAEDTKDKVKEEAYDVKEKAEETAETMTEKAKKTVKEAWGAAKEKSQQVKESVMGPDKEDSERESHG